MVRNKGARMASLVAVGVLAFGALAACGDDSDDGDSGSSGDSGSGDAAAEGKVGVILPDETTSPRWEANDRPSLQAAFESGLDQARDKPLGTGQIEFAGIDLGEDVIQSARGSHLCCDIGTALRFLWFGHKVHHVSFQTDRSLTQNI